MYLPLENPKLGKCELQLWPIQQEAFLACRRALTEHNSAGCIMPTGTGKTVLFAFIARSCIEMGGRVLILAHRVILADQAANQLQKVGITAGIERSENYARSIFDPDAVISLVQTMKGDRLRTWDKDYFDLIIVDEGHHALAKSYLEILAHFDKAKVLLVTATPDRADEHDIEDICETIAYELDLWQAMKAPPPGPYVCRLEIVKCDIGIDLRGIRSTAGDYNLEDLEKRITPHATVISNAIAKEIGDRQTIVFCPDIASSMLIASALSGDKEDGGIGLKSVSVWGDDSNRVEKIKSYTNSETQVLVNCNLATEGFDAPETSAVVLCRPTKSRSLYSQMVGRGTRLKKDGGNCKIVDFSWITDGARSGHEDLCRSADLFDRTDQDSEVSICFQELLDTTVEDGVARIDLLDGIERAKGEAKKRKEIRIRTKAREVAYKRVSYDPLSMMEAIGIPLRGKLMPDYDVQASDKQINLLAKFGITDANTMSKRRASKLIDTILQRRKQGLASPKQVAWMIARAGMTPEQARCVPFLDAKEILDRAFRRK